jgi:transposase
MKDGTRVNLKDFSGQNARFKAKVIAWEEELEFEVKTANGNTWYLVTNLEDREITEKYEFRFKIEKLFQDLKSSGYSIEDTRIRKYDRAKRLLYIACLSHALLVILGAFIKWCKKNCTNHWGLVIACLGLESRHFSYLDGVNESCF